MPPQRSIAVVGGGFGGVAAVVMLRRAGYRDVTVFERGDRIGGVWHHNTHPGAACDIPSHLYEFSFAPNPRWSRRYAPQREIQEYLEQVVRAHGLEERIKTGTEVQQARWDAPRERWILRTSAGVHEADILLTACGQLSVPSVPSISGLDQFQGPAFHTARWEHDVELSGRRVAVLGTGCSAIQVVPAIQPLVGQVDIYQRSPGWTIPRMDFEYSERAKRLFERFPILQRLDRASIFALAVDLERLPPQDRGLGARSVRARRGQQIELVFGSFGACIRGKATPRLESKSTGLRHRARPRR